jgi:hypothetical protein
MDNQHKKIAGYRDLDQAEIDLMNEIKEHGRRTAALLKKVGDHVSAQRTACYLHANLPEAEFGRRKAEGERLSAAGAERWISMASTDLQVGLMKLTRAVAQPTTF